MMIPYQQAYDQMMAAATPLGSETVDLQDACGRILAADVAADMDMPPFDKSAMDGYAGRRCDLAQELKVIEEIPAGRLPTKRIGPGQCAKIMTGAPVPEGADCVVMRELVDEVGKPGWIRNADPKTADNICRQGEDTRTGDTVLTAGERVTPAHIAVLATVGCVRPLVARRPVVAVLATGSELVEPDQRPEAAAIRNSNSYQLVAQIQAMGAEPRYLGIVPDTVADTDAALKKAMEISDLIVLSGGVSVGDYDFVPGVLKQNNFSFLFDSVAMKPGKPTLFARNGSIFTCGLPGNPVSTFVIFEILLKPFLYRLMGHDYQAGCVPSTLAEAMIRKQTARQSTIPVAFVAPGVVAPVEYHGSAHINAMARAHGLVTIPVGCNGFKKGETVDVRPL